MTARAEMAYEHDYSPTIAGYEAWLADGNKGEFTDFISRIVTKGRRQLLAEIGYEIGNLNAEELQRVLDFIVNREF